jgi:hypothetical protein
MEPRRRFTVEQYHQMIRACILTDDDPVELLEGLLVKKPKATLAFANPRFTVLQVCWAGN